MRAGLEAGDGMALLIKSGRIITATDDYTADIYCADHAVTRIDRHIDPAECGPGVEIVEAAGKYVFPGFIDPHVHVYLPFMGTFAKDTWESASKAALVGGTTTLVEMICPGRGEDPVDAFELWLGKAVGTSACDFSFHMGVTRWDESMPAKLRSIVERGIRSFKVFLAYKGALGIDDRELYHALKLAAELGVVVTAHCGRLVPRSACTSRAAVAVELPDVADFLDHVQVQIGDDDLVLVAGRLAMILPRGSQK
jgi:dihydropyrimidinase